MDKKILALSILLIVTFAAFAVYVILNNTGNIFARTETNTNASTSSSLIFAWPLEVKADGKTKSEITVFIQNSEGKGLVNKKVDLTTNLGSIDTSVPLTGDDGKAVFTLTSTETGVAQIEAMVDNMKLQRTITVKFN